MEARPGTTRPRFSNILQHQVDYLAPMMDEQRRSRGRALGRLATLLLLLAVVVVIASQTAVASQVDQIGAGTLLFRSDSGDVAAPRLDTEVDIAVSGMIARVDVRQSFRNDSVEFVEGKYVFPLPDNAAVDSLKLRIGERVIVGEIREKSEARKTYQQAKQSGKRTSLVEQQRPNLFTTAVANIAPGETIEVEIGYLQTLDYLQGAFSLRFPMTVTPRYQPEATPILASTDIDSICCQQSPHDTAMPLSYHHPDAAGNEAQINVRIDAGFPLARIESLYHSMDTVEAGNIVLLTPATGKVPMNRDFELVWQPALGSAPQAAVFSERLSGQDYALIMLMPPNTDGMTTAMPREIVYVIDTSGSMSGSSIKQARAALRFAIDRLSPANRFNVIRFASDASKLFAHSVAADELNKDKARKFIRRLRADGGTEISAALDLALDSQADQRATADGFLRQVVFVTDGSVGNEQQLFAQITAQLGNTRLFSVGIGSAPNAWFMRKSARFGRGTYTHIGGDHMIEERMESLLARLESPVLRDIEIEAPPGAIVSPERIGDLYADEPIVVRAKLQSAKGNFRLRGRRANLPWSKTVQVPGQDDNPGVAALWARGRIEALMDSVVTGADPQQVRAEVLKLALNHHLVSRYTSLVAVDYTPNRAPGTAMATKKVPANVPYGSTMTGYPAGATPSALLALLGLLSLLASAAAALTGRWR
ncbi:MAG: marine proteobacterial sortase target protein [Gammaproteobacteria bacterium]|nr:marine proteobacterial sortase target protein [Gammaproteobacteria bacterium]